MTFDVLTIGSGVRDMFMFLDDRDIEILDNPRRDITRKKLIGLEYGAKIEARKSIVSIGGGAANTATTFARHGFSVGAMLSIGDDSGGEAILQSLVREGVDTSYIHRNKTLTSGFSVLLVTGSRGEHVAIVERGASQDIVLPKKSNPFKNTAWIYTTAMCGERWQVTLDRVIEAVRTEGVKWAWNPGSEQLTEGSGGLGRYLKQCTVLLLNRDEALGLAQSERGKAVDDTPAALLDFLLHWGPQCVVITDGKHGAYYGDAKQKVFMTADSNVEPIESTGAGDAFGSGFVSGLIETGMSNIPYALDKGITNSESVIGHIGAQKGILRKKEVEDRIKNTRHTVRTMEHS